MNDKKLVVLFPGVRYDTSCPLLYYAGFKFENRGYEKIDITYGNLLEQDKSLEECIEDVKNSILNQLKGVQFSKYDDIVFVSKSLGTAIAGWLEERLCIKVRQIYLTPIKETLAYINNKKNIIIVVAGTNDKYLEGDILKEHCIKENVPLKQIQNVGHRLEYKNNVIKSIELIKEIVSLY